MIWLKLPAASSLMHFPRHHTATMAITLISLSFVRLEKSSAPASTSTAPPLSGAPYDPSAFVILAAVLGSIVLGIAFLWLVKCAYADRLLRQASRRRQGSGYLLPLSSTSSGSPTRFVCQIAYHVILFLADGRTHTEQPPYGSQGSSESLFLTQPKFLLSMFLRHGPMTTTQRIRPGSAYQSDSDQDGAVPSGSRCAGQGEKRSDDGPGGNTTFSPVWVLLTRRLG